MSISLSDCQFIQIVCYFIYVDYCLMTSACSYFLNSHYLSVITVSFVIFDYYYRIYFYLFIIPMMTSQTMTTHRLQFVYYIKPDIYDYDCCYDYDYSTSYDSYLSYFFYHNNELIYFSFVILAHLGCYCYHHCVVILILLQVIYYCFSSYIQHSDKSIYEFVRFIVVCQAIYQFFDFMIISYFVFVLLEYSSVIFVIDQSKYPLYHLLVSIARFISENLLLCSKYVCYAKLYVYAAAELAIHHHETMIQILMMNLITDFTFDQYDYIVCMMSLFNYVDYVDDEKSLDYHHLIYSFVVLMRMIVVITFSYWLFEFLFYIDGLLNKLEQLNLRIYYYTYQRVNQKINNKVEQQRKINKQNSKYQKKIPNNQIVGFEIIFNYINFNLTFLLLRQFQKLLIQIKLFKNNKTRPNNLLTLILIQFHPSIQKDQNSVLQLQKTVIIHIYQKLYHFFHIQPNIMDGQFIIQKYQQFQDKLNTRQKIRISLGPLFQSQLDIMQYIILSKFQKNAKHLYKEKKNKLCDKLFKKSFKELTDMEKFYYYIMIISHLENIVNQDLTPPRFRQGSIKTNAYSKTYSKIGWKEVMLKIDFDKRYLYIQRQNKLNAYDLNNYLLRKSKTTDYNSLVLEAINQVVNEKGYQIHIGFKDVKIFRQWYQAIKIMVEYVFWEKIKKIVFPSEVFACLQKNKLQAEIQVQIKDVEVEVEDNPKLYQSTFVSSQRRIQIDSLDNMSKSVMKRISQSQSQKSHQKSQKSCHSIEIKSPRSSIKSNQVQIQVQQNGQTFRSLGMLTGQDIDYGIQESNIFRRLLPEYQLQFIDQINQSNQQVYTSTSKKGDEFQIFSNTQDAKNIKLFISIKKTNLKMSFDKFSSLFSSPQFFKQINDQIQQLTVKTILGSQNCLILYQKNKTYNRLYRSRDFLFIRHQFKKQNKLYIIDKSVQDSTVPPFTTIVRGQIRIVYEIYQQVEDGLIRINIDVKSQNYGYLKELQQLNLNIKFFKGFQNISIKVQKGNFERISPLLEKQWPIKKKQINTNTQHQNNNQINSQNEQEDNVEQVTNYIIPEQNDNYTKIKQEESKSTTLTLVSSQSHKRHISNLKLEEDVTTTENIEQIAQSVQKMQLQGQISVNQVQNQKLTNKMVRYFDHEGRVIIDYSFISKKQQVYPEPQNSKEKNYLKRINDQHPIWQGNWQFPEEGGLKFTNQKQIDDQKGVLKFILSQVAKNLVSGKSILNISLPVDIFSSQSNLQLFVYSMSYAPCLLEQATKANQLDRFLKTVVFGMTNSPLYLQMQKPFNPIIGETFQCYINGCPAYAQQISHHPPIAAFMLTGRGYRVSAQIQSKMKLNINSGTGVNEGVYRIRFDNQQQICYICPGGEVSGLAYGDRKFNMVGKSITWCQKTGLFLELLFNPKKSFFGKQQTPIDYVQGRVYRVKDTFFKSFLKNYSGSPKKNEIIQQFGKFHGRWNRQLKYEDRVLFNYDIEFPVQIQHEQNPLASDSNWREDITYRRLLQISLAQSWKQKLQVQQRAQRKLRQKYVHPKK